MKKYNVLFVDDEINILNSLKRITVDEDYYVITVASAEKALEVFDKYEISVIITDMKMPGMNGLDLLKRVKEISPNTIRIILSGYSQLPQILATVNTVGIFRYLTKPWEGEEDFLLSIREAINIYSIHAESNKLKHELENKSMLYKTLLDNNHSIMVSFEKDILNIKKIFENLLNMQRYLLFIMKKNQITLEETTIYIDELNNHLIRFINNIPGIKNRFNIENLMIDLTSKFNSDVKVNVSGKDLNYIGNYKIIFLILEIAIGTIKKVLPLKNKIEVDIFINSSLIIIIRSENIDFSAIKENNLYFKLNISILNDFCNFLGGKITIDKEKGIIIDIKTKI